MIFQIQSIIYGFFNSFGVMKRIIIINGPNLNLLGKREPEIYGERSFDDFFIDLKKVFSEIDLSYFQSNIEGEIIDKLHEVGFHI